MGSMAGQEKQQSSLGELLTDLSSFCGSLRDRHNYTLLFNSSFDLLSTETEKGEKDVGNVNGFFGRGKDISFLNQPTFHPVTGWYELSCVKSALFSYTTIYLSYLYMSFFFTQHINFEDP